jgi:hypothetical protein
MKISAATAAATAAFKPNRQESKAQITDATARAIIDTEAAKRDAKTAKLRAARLAQEQADAEKAAAEPPKAAPRAKRKRAQRA